MKKMIGKKLLFSVIVLSMIAFVSVDGALAWFKGAALGKVGNFRTAKVEMEFDSEFSGEVTVMEPDIDISTLLLLVDLQGPIQADFKEGKFYNFDRIFSNWWKELDDFGNYFIATHPENTLNLGSFAFCEYNFINNTNVPVYFRINKAAINVIPDVPDETLYTAAIAWNVNDENKYNIWDFNKNRDCLLVDGGDGYYYCPEPFEPGKDPSIVFAIYVLGGKDVNSPDFKGGKITFDVDSAELIQATNNAVLMAEGWKDVVDRVGFKPYIEEVQ